MAVSFRQIQSNLENPATQKRLFNEFKKSAYEIYSKQRNIEEELKKQRLDHTGKIFTMVYRMTIVTYVFVLILIISQVINIDGLDPRTIVFEPMSLDKFALILSGFLAELLLLPKIILNGLFTSKETKD